MKFNFTPFPELKTDRLFLRQLTPEDKNEIFAIRSDAEITKYLDRPLYKNVDEASGFISKINNGIKNNEWIYWAINYQNQSKLIGTICLWKFSEKKSKAEIGFELLPEFQGKGIMTEAVPAVLNYGFNVLKLDSIEGEVSPENLNSIRLMKKFNFKKDEELKKENSVTVIYSLLKDDFKN